MTTRRFEKIPLMLTVIVGLATLSPHRANPDSRGRPIARPGPRLCYDLPVNVGTLINTANFEGGPSLSQDGLTLLFGAARQNSLGQLDEDIFIATRETTSRIVRPAAESGCPGQRSRLRRLFP